MKIAVQLEDTITKASDPLGDPIAGALDFLAALVNAGHEVLIVTPLATDPQKMGWVYDWLIRHGAYYTDVWCVQGWPEVDRIVSAKAGFKPTAAGFKQFINSVSE